MITMKTVRAVAAIIRRGNKVFATAKGYGEHKGWWEFPGGKIEPGETPKEALKREIMEELAVEIEVGELLDTVEYSYPKFHLSMDCFWARITGGKIVLVEAEDARWLGTDDIDSVRWLPADLGLVQKIKESLKDSDQR